MLSEIFYKDFIAFDTNEAILSFVYFLTFSL